MKRDNDFDLKLLTTKEAAKILRLSERTLEAMRRSGKGPPFTRLGYDRSAKVVYRVASLLDWLADKTHDKVVPTSKFRTSPAPHHERGSTGSEEDEGWVDAFLCHYANARRRG